LRRVGFKTREASNGKEGFEAFKTWEPHAVLMDLRMPVMDGFEAAKRIRTQEKKRKSHITHTVIIALTASLVPKEKESELHSDFDAFIYKPYSEEKLFEILQNHLHVRYRYKENPLLRGDPERTSAVIVEPEDIALIPHNIFSELKDAVMKLDACKITSLIDQLKPTYPDIVQELKKLTGKFQYHYILDLLVKAEKSIEKRKKKKEVTL
jgi:CheY-like chemotaxis protein